MKKILVFVCAMFIIAVLRTNSQTKQYQMFGVAFYNLENLFDTINNNGVYDKEFSPEGARQWNGDKYWKKIYNMSYTLSQMFSKGTPQGPAIIGVSEIENKTVLEDLVRHENLKRWRLQIVHHDSPDRRGVDVGLLYNPRFFQVLNVVNTRLTVEGQPNFKTRDQMCVTGLLAGEKVSVIVNHWPSRLGGEAQSSYLREAAAARVKATVDSLIADDPNQGIIIMGDLNDDPHNRSCAVVLDAKKKVKDVKENGLYNPWWSMLDNGIGTLAYKGQWNLFDQIIISDYFLNSNRQHLTFLKAEVFNREFLRTKDGDRLGYPLRTFSGGVFLNGYSDHFPTQIFLVREANKAK